MKILIVEDDPVSRRVLEAFLEEWNYEIIVTRDGSEAWDVLQQPQAPSLILSDWMMPDMDGVALCKKIRELKRADYVYFIMLTSKGEKEDAIEGFVSGVDDFIIKPFDPDELRYRVKIGERIIKLKQRILELAKTDHLTGLLNRRAFMERMAQELQRSYREKSTFAIILSDIDYFKKVNDNYGHQAGDKALKKFADQMKMLLRPYDLLARYGGEEFIFYTPGADLLGAKSIAERLRESAEDMKINLPDISQSIQITASFGVSMFAADADDDLDALIKRADEALYKAKNDGRNCVRLG